MRVSTSIVAYLIFELRAFLGLKDETKILFRVQKVCLYLLELRRN